MGVEDDTVMERAVVFGAGSPLVGIISEPSAPLQRSRPAVVLLNAGFHRVGASRLTVRMARRLCDAGWLVARFDQSGIGDSVARRDGLKVDEAGVVEARQVMDELSATYDVERFVLIGHCKGGLVSFRTAQADPRVAGAVLLNSHGIQANPDWHKYASVQSAARQYRRSSLRSPDSWKRALTGRIQYGRLIGTLAKSMAQRLVPSAPSSLNRRFSQELRQLVEQGTHLLFILTDGDPAQGCLNVIAESQMGYLRSSGRFRTEAISRSDHDYTLLANQADVLRLVEDWMATWSRSEQRLA